MLFSPLRKETFPENAMHFSGISMSIDSLNIEGKATASIEPVKSDIFKNAILSLFFVITCLEVSIIPAIAGGAK